MAWAERVTSLSGRRMARLVYQARVPARTTAAPRPRPKYSSESLAVRRASRAASSMFFWLMSRMRRDTFLISVNVSKSPASKYMSRRRGSIGFKA